VLLKKLRGGIAMGFGVGNQEWRKRSANKGGRATRRETMKKKARQDAMNHRIRKWAEAKADWDFATMIGFRNKRCPVCGKIS
jgi:hypothetical protein